MIVGIVYKRDLAKTYYIEHVREFYCNQKDFLIYRFDWATPQYLNRKEIAFVKITPEE